MTQSTNWRGEIRGVLHAVMLPLLLWSVFGHTGRSELPGTADCPPPVMQCKCLVQDATPAGY